MLSAQPALPQADDAAAAAEPTHLSEARRGDIRRLVVISNWTGTDQDLSGTYGKDTPGLVGGMERGSRIGRIYKEVGPVPVYIPIPGLALPGAIFGGLTGAAKREVQEFRDRMTEELAREDSQVLTDDGLALDVFWGVRRLPGIDSKLFAAGAELPEDTDALLFVRFEGVEIDVQGKEAEITTVASTTLRQGDGRELYRQFVHYRDRDTLRNWTADDNALWRTYSNFARHYLAREITAEVFDRVALEHALVPLETETVSADRRDPRRFETDDGQPTLAWRLDLPDPPPGLGATAFDLEIYDARELVYAEEGLGSTEHRIAVPLEPCTNYRWSVRPSWDIDGRRRYGEWLRLDPPPPPDSRRGKKKKADENSVSGVDETAEGRWLIGRQASVAPAYTQDFPVLATDCRRR